MPIQKEIKTPIIHYLKHGEIDKNKWDDAIRHAFNGNIYAFSWYLDRVHNDWEALVENDYERVMPLIGRKKWGIWYLFQPFFAQQLGVFSTNILTSKHVADFIYNIPKKFAFAQINLNIYNHPVLKSSYRLVPNKNYLLDLIHDYRKLSAHYSANAKRNLKRSLNMGLSISKNLNPEALIKLFRQNKGNQIKHWKDNDYRHLQELMYIAVHKGKGIFYGVYSRQNELCAAAFFLLGNQHLIFLFSGSNVQARQNGAMTFLLDNVVREHAGSKLILDFEGSNDLNLARFYHGFGAKEVNYNRLEFNMLPFPIKNLVNWRFKHHK